MEDVLGFRPGTTLLLGDDIVEMMVCRRCTQGMTFIEASLPSLLGVGIPSYCSYWNYRVFIIK